MILESGQHRVEMGTIRDTVRIKSILELLVETLNQLCEVGSVSTAIDEYVRGAVE